MIIAGPVGDRSDSACEYWVQLYYAALDVIISEMKERFNSVNLSLMKALQALNPKPDSCIDHDVIKPLLLSHYNISGKEVEVELLTTKTMPLRDDRDHDQLKDIHGFYNRFSPVS